MRHLLSLRELPREEILTLLNRAEQYIAAGRPAPPILRGQVVATLFYEPSTRTELSFELAAKRLGAHALRCDVERSSVQKGESLLETVRTLAALGAEAIVLRHPAAGSAHQAAAVSAAAVINGGDGMHEHPTQGLVDLFTVRRHFGAVAGLKVTIVGDVRHSRVARSAVWGFTKLGATVTFVGPSTLLPVAGALPARVTTSLEEGLSGASVVMALRMQLERQAGGDVPSLSEFAAGYGLSRRVLSLARSDAIVMHPGPMNLGVEITAEVAYGPQSVIAEQVANGVAVRMAVLEWALQSEAVRSAQPAEQAQVPAGVAHP